MIEGLVAGLVVVVAIALFIGGIAIGAWLEHEHGRSR